MAEPKLHSPRHEPRVREEPHAPAIVGGGARGDDPRRAGVYGVPAVGARGARASSRPRPHGRLGEVAASVVNPQGAVVPRRHLHMDAVHAVLQRAGERAADERHAVPGIAGEVVLHE